MGRINLIDRNIEKDQYSMQKADTSIDKSKELVMKFSSD